MKAHLGSGPYVDLLRKEAALLVMAPTVHLANAPGHDVAGRRQIVGGIILLADLLQSLATNVAAAPAAHSLTGNSEKVSALLFII